MVKGHVSDVDYSLTRLWGKAEGLQAAAIHFLHLKRRRTQRAPFSTTSSHAHALLAARNTKIPYYHTKATPSRAHHRHLFRQTFRFKIFINEIEISTHLHAAQAFRMRDRSEIRLFHPFAWQRR